MDDGVQLYFCEFCNQSVPQKDLDSGAARKVNDRVAGACCLPLLVPAGATGVRGTEPGQTGVTGARVPAEPGALLALGAVCLVAIAGSAFYLDWRLGAGLERQGRQVVAQTGEIQAVAERVRTVESRIDDVVRRPDLEAVAATLSTEPLRSAVRGLDERVRNQMADGQRTLADARLQAEQASQRTAQLERSLDQFGKALDAIHSEIKELRAGGAANAGGAGAPAQSGAPERAPVQPGPMSGGPGVGTPASQPGQAPELPKNLQHYVQQLTDPDAGTRWNAVDALAKSGDPRVVPHLIAVLKDGDPFVRRFCAGSLGELKAREALAPLIDLLSDRELIVREAAQRSLRKISGQNIEFDAEAAPGRRDEAIQRWRDWLQAQGGK